jgi:cyanophycinase-like exopeptidase
VSKANWPEWTSGALRATLEDAEEEARERGHRVVLPEHLALALLRRPSPVWPLLQSLKVEPRRWRDYINHVIGVNQGMREERDRQLHDRPPNPAALRYDGELVIGPGTASVVARTHEIAGDNTGPEHLLIAFFGGHGDIAAGTARWMGLTENRVRAMVGLPPQTVDYQVGPGNRPATGGPLILMGSCHHNSETLDRIVTIAGAESSELVRATAVFAAGGQPDMELARLFDQAGATMMDSGIYSRADAHNPESCELLRRADVIHVDGGNVKRLCDVLVGTPALDAMVDANERGAVISGCSAGMHVLGAGCTEDWPAPGDPAGPFPLLGWLPDVVLEPHCSGERSVERLRRAMRSFPGTRGLGIAHQGAVLIHPGWRRIESIAAGFGLGNFLLAGPDTEPLPILQTPIDLF